MHQVKWTGVCRTVYTAVARVCEYKSVRALALLMIIHIETQPAYQDLVASVYLPFGLCVYVDLNTLELSKYRHYTLEEFRQKLLSVVWL